MNMIWINECDLKGNDESASMLSILKVIRVPSSVEFIGASWFCDCRSLSEVIFDGNPVIGSNAFLSCPRRKRVKPSLIGGTPIVERAFSSSFGTVVKNRSWSAHRHKRSKFYSLFNLQCVTSLICRYHQGTYGDPCYGLSTMRTPAGATTCCFSLWPMKCVKLNAFLFSGIVCLIGKWAVTNRILYR
jgi:hypothetical protein